MSSCSPSNLQVVACWSKAGIGTCIVLEYKSQQQQQNKQTKNATTTSTSLGKFRFGSRLVLDLGATPCFDQAITANIVLISHGHLDHIGAIFSHARAVSCEKGFTPTYYVPSGIVTLLEQAKQAMCLVDSANDGSLGARDKSILDMNVIGVNPGEEHILPIRKHLNGAQLFIKVFGVTHAGCPAVGYIIGSRHPPTLRDEFKGKSQKEIRDLVASGVQIKHDPVDVLEVAYTGDTTVEALRALPRARRIDDEVDEQDTQVTNPPVFSCKTLITETTYLETTDNAAELAARGGHMRVTDVVSVLNEKGWNGNELFLIHFSARYSPAAALNHLLEALPEKLIQKTWVAIASLMSPNDDGPLCSLVQPNGCVRLYDYLQAVVATRTPDSVAIPINTKNGA